MSAEQSRPSDNVHGEGNYEASRRFNREEKEFVQSGKVDEAARKARPASSSEAREMEKAEQEGRSRARGGDEPGAMKESSGKPADK